MLNKPKNYRIIEQTMMFLLLLTAAGLMVQTASAKIYINGSNSGDSFNMEIPDTESQASYTVYQPWYLPGYTIAKNGSSGRIDYIGTNSAVVINSSIQNTQNGGTVLIKKGTYTLLQTFYGKKNVTIKGEGKYGATVLKVANKVQSSLISNANSGQKNLVVADTTGFLVGQDVTIFDNVNTGYGLGDSGRIASINAGTNTITLESNLFRSYTVANSGYVFTTFSAISLDKPTFASGLPNAAGGITNVIIESLEIDGNKANNALGNYDEVQSGITLGNSHNTTVQNVYVHDTVYGGILSSHYIDGSYDGSDNVKILNNHVENVWAKDLLHFHGLTNSLVSGNTLRNNTQGTDTAIYLFQSRNNTITGNNIQGKNIGIYVFLANDSTFQNNKIQNVGNYGFYLTDSSNNIIDGNSVYNSGFYGIDIAVSAVGSIASDSNVVTDNTFVNGADAAIILNGNSNATVVGNTIRNPGNQGILSIAKNSVISENHIYMNVGANAIDNNGGSGQGNSIIGNVIYKTSAGNFGYGIYNTAGNVTIVGNAINNGVTTTAAIFNTGDGVVIVGNAVKNSNTTRIYSNPALTNNEIAHNTGT